MSLAQDKLLGIALMAMTGGSVQAHVGTGGGGSSPSDLPWGERKKYRNGRGYIAIS